MIVKSLVCPIKLPIFLRINSLPYLYKRTLTPYTGASSVETTEESIRVPCSILC